MTYNLCKKVIQAKTYGTVEEMTEKLDVFLLNKRITADQYNELIALLNQDQPPK